MGFKEAVNEQAWRQSITNKTHTKFRDQRSNVKSALGGPLNSGTDQIPMLVKETENIHIQMQDPKCLTAVLKPLFKESFACVIMFIPFIVPIC